MLGPRLLAAAAGRRGAGGGPGPGGGWIEGADADSVALFERMAPAPSAGLQADIDTCIKALKAGSNPWSTLDLLYLFVTDDRANAPLNWLPNGLADGTEIAAPAWTPTSGYTAAGSAYVRSATVAGFTQFLDGTSGHIGGWALSSAATDTPLLRATTISKGSIYHRKTGDGAQACLMSSGIAYLAGTNTTNVPEHYVAVRSSAAANATQLYKAGSAFGAPFGDAATALGGSAAFVMPGSTAGNAVTIAAAHIGGALTATQVVELRAALRAYLVARGAI